MSKWVYVPIIISKTYAIEIEDNESVEDAQKIVSGLHFDDIEFMECEMERDEHDAERIKAHADEAISIGL